MWRHISAFLPVYCVYMRKGLTTYTVWADLDLILLVSKWGRGLASIITQLLKLRASYNTSEGKTSLETFTESLLCLEEKIRRIEDSQYSVDFVLCLEIIAGNHPKSPAPTMTSPYNNWLWAVRKSRVWWVVILGLPFSCSTLAFPELSGRPSTQGIEESLNPLETDCPAKTSERI